ncbi:hypothetical protein DKX38_004116 [Salix brachista]|uniref:Pentacotripeptide-repeat region of PRORP domain-containing protein n=1 Tax=Salix brachista TaxID=2182728 RepID=A0A5N5NA65_9ROSI|nr:hypothetical protein DKX38_004116 [Salix brachista]
MMLCMYKRHERFEEATQIAKQMRDLGLLTDLLSYNNVLGLYALDGRFKEAVGIFKEMVEVSVQPSDCTFKSLGIVLVKCGISKKAVGKLGAMTKNDYQKGLQAWVLSLSTVADVDDDYDDILLSSSKSFENIRMPGTWMALSALVFWLSGNEWINAPARMRMADNEKAEAKKILQIKCAEDDAESNISGLDGM